MAHANTVIRSINLPDETICVDLFRRPDGSFGFNEFRRDAEDGRGWFAIAHHDAASFATADDALQAARKSITWLDELLENP